MNTLEKYMKHARKSDMITNNPNIEKRIMQLPVCPRCERPALRDTRKGDPERRFITCPICGYHGPFTHSIRTHVEEYTGADIPKVQSDRDLIHGLLRKR